jgi:hypothetical protein
MADHYQTTEVSDF